MRVFALLMVLFVPAIDANAQNAKDSGTDTLRRVRPIVTYDRIFQFSLFPGISTNGENSESYVNMFSLNALGGHSAGNRAVEAGIMLNSNRFSVKGIQVAGLANVLGVGAYKTLTVSEERTLINNGSESSSRSFQLAGFINFVRDDATGVQMAGATNIVRRDMKGVQISLVGNAVRDHAEGLQLAGLYNLAGKSASGMQVSILFNYTNRELNGVQLGLVNKTRIIKGHKTQPPTKARGIQLGLVNFSKSMHGTQIGLVNFGGSLRGRQIGLINFFSRAPTKEYTTNGTPIGLLNKGSFGTTYRVYFDETFPLNFERTSGNCWNCTHTQSQMPYEDKNQIFNQNALILGFDPATGMWGFGYGFMKMLYNKSSMNPKDKFNRKRMMTYGVKFIHMNKDRKFDPTFNMLTRLNLEYGIRRWPGYIFISASLNYFLQNTEHGNFYEMKRAVTSFQQSSNLQGSFWPGVGIGFQFWTNSRF